MFWTCTAPQLPHTILGMNLRSISFPGADISDLLV